MEYIVKWFDPDDYDQGANNGVDTFTDSDEVCEFLEKKDQSCPNLLYTVWHGTEVKFEAVNVATKYRKAL